MKGALQAGLRASWGGGGPPQLSGQVRASDVRITRLFGLGESVTMDWERAEVRAQWQDDALALSAEVDRQGRRVLDLSARLPHDREAAMEGVARLDGLHLAMLAPWATAFSDLDGTLSGEFRLGGSANRPAFDGQLRLAGGHVLLEGNPTPLTDLELLLSLDDGGGHLTGSGLLGGGELQIDGRLQLRPEYRLDVSLRGERQQILVPPASQALISEDLHVILSGRLLDVSGEVKVHEGTLRHEELPEGGVALSDDVVQVDTLGRVIREEQPFDIRADLWVRVDPLFEVLGEHLQATLGGDLHLLGEPGAAPQVFGSLNLVGGQLEAYGQNLRIKRGLVDFSGPVDNPDINIEAERRIRADDVTVGARLVGSLSEPELEIYSQPAMSQGEAMSYLVRGRGLDTGAGADGTALALALGANAVNRSGILAGLDELPLLHGVALGASGEEDATAATVSGYLGDRIYLSYGIGLYEPINEFTARLYLRTRLWLEVVSRLENSLDLYYSFDID